MAERHRWKLPFRRARSFKAGSYNSSPHRRPLRFEPLEDRRVLAVFAVTNLDDAGEGSLRHAIIEANDTPGADTIDLSAVSGTIALATGELEITEALGIEGPGQDVLTIDAQQQSRVFNITAVSGDFTIAGMTLTGGRTTGDNSSSPDPFFGVYSGGGIRSLTYGKLTIERTTITGNSTEGAWAHGGGIYAPRGEVTITESTITGNSTANDIAAGGGMFVANGFLGGGGPLYPTLTVNQSTISGNSSVLAGGGIFGDFITLYQSTVSDNAAGTGGGMLGQWSITLNHSTVSGNSASSENGWGGGINSIGDVTLTESTVSGNSAYRGGGIFADFGAATLTRSTVVENHASTFGGGIWTDDRPIVVFGSIVAGNTAGLSRPDLGSGTGPIAVNFTLVGDKSGTTLVEAHTPDADGNLIGGPGEGVIDPLIGPLASHGGPTMTHPLLPDSPAIDAGDPAAMAGLDGVPEFDQRGVPWSRVVGGRIDMGAFELRVLPPGDFNGDGMVVNADLTLLLNNWGKLVPPAPAGWLGTQPTAPAVNNNELTQLLNSWGRTLAEGGESGILSVAGEQLLPESDVLVRTTTVPLALAATNAWPKPSTAAAPSVPGRRGIESPPTASASRKSDPVIQWLASRTASQTDAGEAATALLVDRFATEASGPMPDAVDRVFELIGSV